MISEKQYEEIQKTKSSLSPQLSKEQRELQIRKEAKKILDNFAKALSSVKIEEKKLKNKIGGFREEKDPECDPEFRERMFENAPEKKGDSIIAEKKW